MIKLLGIDVNGLLSAPVGKYVCQAKTAQEHVNKINAHGRNVSITCMQHE